MQIDTKYFGQITIDSDNIIQFESGIPGFLDEKQFVLLPLEETPFWILQSVQTSQIAFVLSDPFVHFPTYEFKLTEEIQQKLQIKAEKEVAVFVILTVADPFSNTTANLKAPIIMNERTKLAKQIILQETTYQTKHLLFQQQTTSADKGE